ncbi:flotillin family protein [Streptomyces sp. NP-1717]|uniref:SPFH domain-containing protein n=1 Tax=unclassified Streptomyces TaxID=2593676 RepID=UPI001F5CE799|nr:flotillin family protein [Streptomyces sp. NP-1717]MCI3221753.1 flotillin [Streptomyces sp. NP-1717]WTA72058.1 SPFH domain-containing protein [Streptomyces sp. NBC_00838]
MLFWRVPAPNEAMLISGSKRQVQDTQFRIVTGHGSFVLPIKQKARMLSLALREAEIAEDCVTQQGIRLTVRAVTVFKVGDDAVSIANAARRFLAEQDRMEELVGRIFAGHLRSIIGGLTVEQIIRERDRVAQEVKAGSHSEMEKLGIVVDALQIQEIEDATGYINNLAAPHAAAVASQARIAAARADQEAAEREQQAAALKAEYERDTSIKRAGFEAQTEQVRARASQAGPLAQAKASQEVIEEQTALAERQAMLAAQRLEAEVRRPADAEAYRRRTLAQAQADANTARAVSLRDGNQELLAANRVVEVLPELVDSAAKGLADSHLTVLNGTDGVNEVAAGLVGQGMTILNSLQGTTGSTRAPSEGEQERTQRTNGKAPARVDRAA